MSVSYDPEAMEDELPPDDEPPVELGTEHDDAPPDEAVTEARARAMGWKPLSEYGGDPRRWKPAAEFVAVAETEMPVLRDQLHRMTDKVTRIEGEVAPLRQQIEGQKESIEALVRLAKRADERGYQRAMKDLQARRDEAVQAGDTETFRQVDGQMKELEQDHAAAPERAPPPPPAPTPASRPALHPDVQAFIDANAAWFNRDPVLTRAMVALNNLVEDDYPSWPPAQQLAEARRQLVERHPDSPYFRDEATMARQPTPQPRRPAAASAARPSAPMRPGDQSQRRSGFDAIADPQERADARREYDKIKRGDPSMTEGVFLEIYNNPHGDVLELLQRAKARK